MGFIDYLYEEYGYHLSTIEKWTIFKLVDDTTVTINPEEYRYTVDVDAEDDVVIITQYAPDNDGGFRKLEELSIPVENIVYMRQRL